MAYTISQFANNQTPALPDLDQNFNAAFLLTPVPCSVAGTNSLILTQNTAGQAASGGIAAYANGLQLCGVAAQTNTGFVAAGMPGLALLNVYVDSSIGPVLLSGNEIAQGCSLTLRYDSALNANAGGWHLVNNANTSGNTITPTLVRASVGLQVGATSSPTLVGVGRATLPFTFTAIGPNSTQDQTWVLSGPTPAQAIVLTLPPPVSTGLQFQSYVSAGTITLRASNSTANSTITPGTVTAQYTAIVFTP